MDLLWSTGSRFLAKDEKEKREYRRLVETSGGILPLEDPSWADWVPGWFGSGWLGPREAPLHQNVVFTPTPPPARLNVTVSHVWGGSPCIILRVVP